MRRQEIYVRQVPTQVPAQQTGPLSCIPCTVSSAGSADSVTQAELAERLAPSEAVGLTNTAVTFNGLI